MKVGWSSAFPVVNFAHPPPMESTPFSQKGGPGIELWLNPANLVGGVFLATLLILRIVAVDRAPDLTDWRIWSTAAIPLLLATIGQSHVMLAGGQGLAAGSTVMFVNVLVMNWMTDSTTSIVFWSILGILVGGAIGTVNGLLVGAYRYPSTAVTMAMGYIVSGMGLFFSWSQNFLERDRFRLALIGELPGHVPVPIVLVAILVVSAAALDRSRLGRWIRAAGAERRMGAPARPSMAIFAAYVIAGLAQGASGVFLAGAIGASDGTTQPMANGPTLLEIYAAVTLGGTVPHLRQGSVLGATFGALTIATVSNLINVDDLPIYTTPALIGALLLAGLYAVRPRLLAARIQPSETKSAAASEFPFGLFGAAAALFAIGIGIEQIGIDPLALLVAGLMATAIGMIVITGQIDISLPSIVVLATLATAHLTHGSEAALPWVVPLVLAGGSAIGLANGLISVKLRVPRLLVTLAIAGFANAASYCLALMVANSFAPLSLLTILMSGPTRISLPAIVLALIPLLALCALTIGPARLWLARLTAPAEQQVLDRSAPLIHGLAGAIAAGIGILLPGYDGQSILSASDTYLLPALLAGQLAGLRLGRRGGNPSMLIVTVPIVVAAQILLAALNLSYPLRTSILGGCFIIAIFAQHRSYERRQIT